MKSCQFQDVCFDHVDRVPTIGKVCGNMFSLGIYCPLHRDNAYQMAHQWLQAFNATHNTPNDKAKRVSVLKPILIKSFLAPRIKDGRVLTHYKDQMECPLCGSRFTKGAWTLHKRCSLHQRLVSEQKNKPLLLASLSPDPPCAVAQLAYNGPDTDLKQETVTKKGRTVTFTIDFD